MQAIVYSEYGPASEVLHLREVEKPTADEGEVLVKVHATSVNYSNTAFVSGKPFIVRLMGAGMRRPDFEILGTDIAGEVEAVGKHVRQFQPGDRVFGDLSDCGRGGYAQFVAVPESALAIMPNNLSYSEAAAVPESALVALQGLRDMGEIKSGQDVLISGASGGIGSFAVQIAKYYGARVTAVCSTRNVEMVSEIGADHVIDYTKEDFAQKEPGYDLILATVGHRSIFDYKRALKPHGRYVCTGGSMTQIFQAMLLGNLLTLSDDRKMGSLLVKINQEDLNFIRELIESGAIHPLIDRQYPLGEAAEAIEYYATGRTRGKVVITIDDDVD
ncbi:MAG: NAD(P)-dependent alcohol dehydrogenase [Candidatus Promineifilaceae bacterium]|nr:NAD(P)-dependent alcohol dehydrogenase [Candidatus Promineifilaceae bacterium]